MIRLGIETSDDFLSKIHKQTHEFVSNVYDDIDIILPDWTDTDTTAQIQPRPTAQKHPQIKFFPPYFNEKSVLLNTIYSNYSYPAYSIYTR